MSRRDKRLTKWKKNTPKTVPKEELLAVVKYYFPNNWRWEGTSHLIVFHEDLKQFRDYQPYGEISLPCSKGQQFKGFYAKKLITALELLEFWSEKEDT